MSDETFEDGGGDGVMSMSSSILGTASNFTESLSTTPQFDGNNTEQESSWTSTMSGILTTPDTPLSSLSQLFTTTIGSNFSESSPTSYFPIRNATTPTPSLSLNFTTSSTLMDILSTTPLPPPEYCVPIPEWTTPQMVLTLIPTSFIMLFMIFGNFLVILAILTQKSLRSPSNMYILSLGITDLLVGLVILPFNVYEMLNIGWDLGNFLCRFWLTADVTLCSSSILHIAAIAVDRFRSINEGLSYAQSRTIPNTLCVCGALWFLSLWIASPPILGWNDWKDQVDTDVCAPTRNLGYIVHSATGAFFIPALVLVGVYMRIYFLLRRKFRERAEMKCLERRTATTTPNSQDDLEDQSSGVDVDTGIGSSMEVMEETEIRGGGGDGGGESTSTGAEGDNGAIPKSKKMTNFFKRKSYRVKKQDHSGEDGMTSTSAAVTSASEDCSEVEGTTSSLRRSRSRSKEGDLDKSSQKEAFANSSSPPKKSTLQRFLARNPVKDERKASEQITAILKKKSKFSLNKERKAAKTLGILMGAFLLCWTPFTITYLLSGILPECYIGLTFFQIVTWGGYLNSAINPVIYNMYSLEFRKAFKKLVVLWDR